MALHSKYEGELLAAFKLTHRGHFLKKEQAEVESWKSGIDPNLGRAGGKHRGDSVVTRGDTEVTMVQRCMWKEQRDPGAPDSQWMHLLALCPLPCASGHSAPRRELRVSVTQSIKNHL